MKFSRRNFLGSSAILLGSRVLKVLGEPSKAPMRFRDIAREAGLTTVPHSTSKRRYIVETMEGGGIALFDCDNDGKLDIVVVNDSTIGRYLKGGDPMITLYHQDSDSGELHFTDITEAAGLTDVLLAPVAYPSKSFPSIKTPKQISCPPASEYRPKRNSRSHKTPHMGSPVGYVKSGVDAGRARSGGTAEAVSPAPKLVVTSMAGFEAATGAAEAP